LISIKIQTILFMTRLLSNYPRYYSFCLLVGFNHAFCAQYQNSKTFRTIWWFQKSFTMLQSQVCNKPKKKKTLNPYLLFTFELIIFIFFSLRCIRKLIKTSKFSSLVWKFFSHKKIIIKRNLIVLGCIYQMFHCKIIFYETIFPIPIPCFGGTPFIYLFLNELQFDSIFIYFSIFLFATDKER